MENTTNTTAAVDNSEFSFKRASQAKETPSNWKFATLSTYRPHFS